MVESFVLITILIVAFGLLKIILLLRFRTRSLSLIVNDLAYDAAVPGFQSKAFLDSVRLAKSMEGNEYDAAIIFMLTQLLVLSDGNETRQFKREKYALIENLVAKSMHGDTLISEHIKMR